MLIKRRRLRPEILLTNRRIQIYNELIFKNFITYSYN